MKRESRSREGAWIEILRIFLPDGCNHTSLP